MITVIIACIIKCTVDLTSTFMTQNNDIWSIYSSYECFSKQELDNNSKGMLINTAAWLFTSLSNRKCFCDEWGGAESRGNGARPVEWMIMNDTCATHRSRVPRRSFGRNKRRSDDIGRRERTRPGSLSSSTVVTPHLTLPKLLRGTRDRWAVQVSFITNYSTGLAPFPRLSAPPHSPQFPSLPFLLLTSSSTPPLPLCFQCGLICPPNIKTDALKYEWRI